MRTKDDVKLYLWFWALYGPFAFALWMFQRGGYLDLLVAMAAGMTVVLSFLLLRRSHRPSGPRLEASVEDAPVPPQELPEVMDLD